MQLAKQTTVRHQTHLSDWCHAMIYEKAPVANIATSTIISNGLSKKLGSVVAQEQAC